MTMTLKSNYKENSADPRLLMAEWDDCQETGGQVAVTDDVELEDDETAQLYEHYRLVVDKKQKMLRVDKFLLDHLSNTSRNRLQKAADAGLSWPMVAQ